MLWRDSHKSFWLCLFLGCLIYMLLNHMFVANARLLFLSMTAWNCFVFLLILGKWWSYFVHLHPNTKILNSAQIMVSFSIFLRTLLCPNHNILLSFWLIGSFDCLLHFVLCKWDQFFPCALTCALLLWVGFSCIIIDSLVYIMFLSIASILCMQSFFVDTYHDYDWTLKKISTWESSYLSLISFIPCRPLCSFPLILMVASVRGCDVSACMFGI